MKDPTAGRRARSALTVVALLSLVLGSARAQAVPRVIDDDAITRAVEVELFADDVVNANAIDVHTLEGVVTLSGTLDTILARERAEAIAEDIMGVRAVVNRIEVVAAAREDGELENAVRDALLRDPATDSFGVQVEASQGIVTLTGAVHSWAEKKLSETVAKGVRGVRSVENRIEVRYAVETADPEIRSEIEDQLANDVRVDDKAIEVAVKSGKVTLSGAVGSLAEKRRASEDAWVGGVKSVDTAPLRVEWWRRDEMRRESAFQPRPDDDVAVAVRDAFTYDPRVGATGPRVHVASGVVTLSGVVDNPASRRAAEEDARNVVGVRRVQNHLKVRPASVPEDEVLEKRVRQALAEDPYVERWGIEVQAVHGSVYLSGHVNGSFEKERAEKVAERVQGTVQVVNNIDYEYAWKWKPDWSIRDSVEDHLFWSPFVDADEVKVSVQNGIVTLAGTVETWGERSAASRSAWEGGAKDVVNKLDVSHEIYGPLSSLP